MTTIATTAAEEVAHIARLIASQPDKRATVATLASLLGWSIQRTFRRLRASALPGAARTAFVRRPSPGVKPRDRGAVAEWGLTLFGLTLAGV